MHRTYNKFLIVSAIILLLGGVYTYFSNSLNARAATPVSPNSAVSSQNGVTPLSTLTTEDQISADTAFLATLTSLKKIKIDTSIFSSTGFKSLNDNTVNLEAVAPGRPNPFAPIDFVVSRNEAPLSPVVTNDATQITNKSAVLNGTINSLPGITSIYFEYGTEPELGKTTPPVKQSLVGTFVTSVTGLESETTYFFRAVAKVGTNVVYGDLISFNTN